MGKIKTHQGTAKRFRKTGSGKILRMKGHRGHLRRRKSKNSKREMDKMHEVESSSFKKRIKRLAPNLGR
ncbi:MAG: 50S ribosomal protein L35 [Chloroflexi bacterium]|nr:50S ribosomal protein L35 [Chloroflexota bacterium]